LRLTDIRAAAGIAHAAGSKLAVDSTFATPIATRPIELGADYVVHSLTKYLCGHGDAIGGALLGPSADLAKIRQRMMVRVGGIISPFNAWLILRGITTLPARMRVHEENALKLAAFLESHPKVKRVLYPGLPSHPQYGLARQQMANTSGMISFQPVDGKAAARALADNLEIIHYAVSLGHQRSLIIYMDVAELLKTTYRLNPAQLEAFQAYAGDGLFRFSVGLEDPEDLMEDLDRALRSI
jgi:methionine-gamma-lyase